MSGTDGNGAGLVETVLQHRSLQSSGLLRFQKGSVKKQLVLSSGRLLFAESSVPEEHLARVLVLMKRIQRRELSNVAAAMRKGLGSEQALLACCALQSSDLLDGGLEQALMILASLYSWRDCDARFYPGDDLLQRDNVLDMDPAEGLVQAARRVVSTRRMPPGMCLRATVSPAPVENSTVLSVLPLNREECYALSLVQPSVAIQEVLPLLSGLNAKGEDLLLRLMLLGLIQSEEARQRPVSEADAPGQAPGTDPIEVQLTDMLARFESASNYEILSVPTDAADQEIKSAYHDLARRYHPDRFTSRDHPESLRELAEKVFTYVTGAYAILSEPASRAQYDETRLASESQVESTLQARSVVDLERDKMAQTLFKAGQAALYRKEYETAVTRLKECVWLRPDVARYHHYLGAAQAEIPRLRKEAEQHLLQALELEHTAIDSRVALGRLYLSVNLRRKAELQLLEVLKWDPQNPEATSLLQSLEKSDP